MQRLARAGWKVVGLDAGPFWDPDADWVSDEAGSHRLYWTEPRVITGTTPSPGFEQFRTWGRRVDGPLRRVHPPIPSLGFSTARSTGSVLTGRSPIMI